MFFVLFVLHDTDALNDVLTAWEECGVSGVTILPSTGLARFRQKGGLREDLPLIPSIDDLTEHIENTNRTLFTIVNDQEMVDRVLAATEAVTGDLDLPNTGILVVMPMVQAKGLNRRI
ncbi:MAG TPA: hypothetical protein PKG95_09230 [Anaerolineaceae bacterium]|nr:hypothetical protein [Anaerolineaceae bacterium]